MAQQTVFMYHVGVNALFRATAVTSLFCTLFLLGNCANRVNSANDTDGAEYLYSVYIEQSSAGIPSFAVVDRLARSLRSREDPYEMVSFLSDHIQHFPRDPNNGSYLIYIGDYYRAAGAPDAAYDYYERALTRYPALIRDDQNTHVAALNRLLGISDEPEKRVRWYRDLLDRFPGYIDTGRTWYYLAGDLGRAGRWDEAYDAYEQFLRYPGTDIPGVPEASATVARDLAFYRSRRDWTSRDLDSLVQSIKNALWSQNTSSLLANRAGVNFFTMSWEQELNDANSQIPSFDIGFFLRTSRIRYADELDLTSNAREAYLRTWGWSHRIPTWYLYFRRVDFPADPEINGAWEWAGIYFGEPL